MSLYFGVGETVDGGHVSVISSFIQSIGFNSVAIASLRLLYSDLQKKFCQYVM